MKKLIFIFPIFLLLIACKKNPVPKPAIESPAAVQLVFPYESSECNVGTDVSATQSSVLFEWSSSKNTDDYELSLKNLSTGILTSQTTTNTELSIVLQRGTPYSWFIISKSNDTTATAQSAIWSFYNAGDGIKFYVPFPADIVSPAMAETITTGATEITLDWNGSDLDNDIIGYDIYFGSTNPPILFLSDVQESTVINVSVASNTVYYWYIVTKDSQENVSTSEVFQFKME